MKNILPSCKVSYQTSALRIVDKIRSMVAMQVIQDEQDGWKNITDMLRASFTCSNNDEVLDVLNHF